ncbi:MAG: D-alanine--D-alanine ligase [Ruminococcaceae bacterium]|nr:D-alanine--D-alanine ligase [Oscillospiraceae bacterium]
MEKIKLLCLFGGKSGEHEVSLVSAHSILENIDREKYDVEMVGITKAGDWYYYTGDIAAIKDGSWCADGASLPRAAISPSVSDSALLVMDGDQIKRIHIDVVFPVMHGANAEDGTLQGLLAISGIPYVGCGCLTSAVAMDKSVTKLILKNLNIPQARSIFIRAEAFAANETVIIERCEQISPYPLFVKPANAGSSVGASKAIDRKSLKAAIETAAAVDNKILIEEYVSGKEIEVAVIGKKRFIASTCGQVIPGSEFYDYDTKYSADSPASYKIPASIKPETAQQIRTYAQQICAVLGVVGLSRVDFFVRRHGAREEIIFNEINTLPGFTSISMYPKLLMHDGMTYSQIIDHLIAIAMGKEE